MPGPTPCSAGTLDRIYKSVVGWDTVTNPADGVLGSVVETRAAFEDRFSRAPGVAAHTGKPLSVGIVSIDGLDTITRDNGRAAGDALIRTIGSTLEKLPGCLCHVSHNRGIEFLLLFDGASAEEAKALIDQARASLASYPQGLALISAGVARCPTEGDPRLVLYAVNDALREARAEGGDRVMIGAVSEAP